MQQFYITKMMLLIFSIIVIGSLCLVCLILKNTYFKEKFSVAPSKYSICNPDTKQKSLDYNNNIQFLVAPIEQALFYEGLFSFIVGNFHPKR